MAAGEATPNPSDFRGRNDCLNGRMTPGAFGNELDDPAQFGSAFDQQYIARSDFSIQVPHVIDDPLLV
ncbi:MAG: hypothetical protein KFF68_18475 [Desulfosarcina sp.]|nr:hypothetical protein [Desulfosarcina sp.]